MDTQTKHICGGIHPDLGCEKSGHRQTFKIILYERTIATAGTYANAQDYIDAYLTGTDWCDAQIEEG